MPQSKGIRTRANRDPLGLFDVDTEVKEYVGAIRANNGSIGLGAIYAVNEFVKGCKRDGVWDLLLDVGLFAGVDNLNAALVKLKTPSGVSRTYINNNFVSGDYVSNGGSAGIKCNGSTKYLNTGFVPMNHASLISAGLFTYVSGTESSGASRVIAGAASATTTRLFFVGWSSGGSRENGAIGVSSGVEFATGSLVSWDGFLGVATNGSRSQQYYRNGIAAGAPVVSSSDVEPTPVFIGALSVGGSPLLYSTRFIRSVIFTRGLTSSQAALLSTRVNSLMAAFGANVY